MKGKVYLVGAGPGDPGLLTIKGKECLQQADVIIYDYLANPTFLKLAKENAELIYVGKKGGDHTLSQEKINQLIVDKAEENKIVARLKGGDPFIFGRGGEEAETIKEAGIKFEWVPGITSAIAAPAYAGIPLTHRDYTSTVAFITGHEDPLKEKSSIQWDKLATGIGTLVFLMGVGNLGKIAKQLILHGRSPDTLVAVIHRGTLYEQKTITGKLSEIAGLAKKHAIKPPSIIVVGDVVKLRQDLNWFETMPLFGKRIIVTRARAQASGFLRQLIDLGADCIEFPTIEVIPPKEVTDLDRAIMDIDVYQWLLFTSVNGVEFFLKRLGDLGKDVRDLKGIKIGAIGPKTAEIWHNIGIKPDLVPNEYRAEAVIDCFKKENLAKGTRILLPRAAEAREILPEELAKMGAQVDVVTVYQTIKPDNDSRNIRKMLEEHMIDMITFTSSSTVTNFLAMFDVGNKQIQEWMQSLTVACIGPITAETARKNGLPVQIVPTDYTIEALTDAIARHFS